MKKIRSNIVIQLLGEKLWVELISIWRSVAEGRNEQCRMTGQPSIKFGQWHSLDFAFEIRNGVDSAVTV